VLGDGKTERSKAGMSRNRVPRLGVWV
jgi:hypothetical protein